MESSETIQSERLGAVLVEKNLITDEQLERALVMQEESGKRLGEILVAEFGVSRLDVAGVLSEQWAAVEKPEAEVSKPVEPLTPAEVHLRRPLGELLVMRGFITADQLDAALEEQRKSGARIGEILVERGAISRLDLAAAISDYGSSAGGPRSPAHVAGPQPSPDGSLGASPPAQGWSADGLALVADLEARLQTLERAAGGAPWQEDLRLVAFDIRAAISAVEARLEAGGSSPAEAELAAALETVSTRIDALESAPVSAELDALRQELEELKTRPAAMEDVAELRATVERLETLPDRADAIPRLAGEVAELVERVSGFAARVDEIALPVAGLAPRLEGLSARVEEVAAAIPVVETDGLVARIELLEEGSRVGGGSLEQLAVEVAGLASRLAEVPDAGELSGRLEAVAEKAEVAQTGVAGLSGRVDELAASVPTEDVIEELRRQLSDLAARAGEDGGAELGAAVASLAARLDGFAARVDEIALPVAGLAPRLEGLSARVEEVAAAIPVVETDGLVARIELLEEGSRVGGGSLEQLAVEVAGLASRLAEVPDAGELSGRLEAVAEKAEVAQTGVAGLSGRVDELAASVPTEDVIEELRRQLSDLAARAGEDGGAELGAAVASLAARLDGFAARVDEIALPVAGLAPRLEGLSARVEEVAAAIPVVETDGLVARIELLEEGSRVGGGSLEQLAVEANELRSQLQDLTITSARAESVALLEAHVSELEHRVAATAELRDEIRRVGASASAGRDSLAHALFARVEEITAAVPTADEVTELRLRVDELASRPMEDHVLQARVGELAARLESLAPVEATVADLTASVAGLDGRIDGGVRDGNARVDGLAEELSMRIGGLAKELTRRIDSLVARADGLVSRDQVEATAAEQAAWIRGELEVLREWTNVHAAAVDVALAEAEDARVTGQQELGNRIDEAAGALRADAEAQARELGTRLGANANETAALRARVDALQESAADRIGWEARLESMLEQRLDELAARITDEVAGARADAEHAVGAVRGKTDALGGRIDELHGLHHADLQDVRGSMERLVGRVDAESGLRAGDAEAARVAEAELSARVDDHAMRSAAAAFEVEQRLQDEIGRLAAQLEERDANGIEARDELRVELERVASSMGWRLERIEESLAADDGAELAELNATVAELGRRLDEQAGLAEEQARATERALRKGLASLGERLVDTESAYADAGKALRRSIERLGAAVVEADARMADQIPVSEEEGCVAFAPTAAGYRLVELPGRPPEIGSTLELDVCDGPLVVTRYGSSPLPLDSRSCAYLERA